MNNFLRSVIAFFRMLFTGKFPKATINDRQTRQSRIDEVFRAIEGESRQIPKDELDLIFKGIKKDIARDGQYSKRNYTAIRPHKDGPEAPEFTVRTRLSSSPNTIREHRLMSQYSKRALSETPANPYDERPCFFEPTFQVGDVVEWGSQSKGTFAYKQGIIIAVVPEGVEKWDVLKMHGLVSDEYGLDRIGKGGKRNHPSFLVEVEGVTGQKKIYHPRVADLSFPK